MTSHISFTRTEPAENYLPPTDLDITYMAERVGLKSYSPDLVRDIANIASGGRILTSSEYREDVDKAVSNKMRDEDNYEGYWTYPQYRGYTRQTDDFHEAVEKTQEYVLKKQEQVCEFLRTLDTQTLPGYTPLEKAVGLLKTLYTKDDGDKYAKQIENEDTMGEPLPIFTQDRGSNAANNLNEFNDFVHSLDDEERELLEGDENKEGGSGHNAGQGLMDIKLAEDMAAGRHHWLKISRNLNALTKFRISKEGKPAPDIMGDDSRRRRINSLDEIAKTTASEFTLPRMYRLYRLATQQTQVRERVSREDKKQLIYMIIDCSVSMRGERAHKSGGILFNRLKAVLKEEAELYFCFFDTKLFEEHSALDAKSAKACMKKFRAKSFEGYGTNILRCLRSTIDRVVNLLESNTLNERPEIVIVTDGESNVSELTAEEFTKHKLRLHTFMVGATNKHLAQVARDTGGVGIDRL